MRLAIAIAASLVAPAYAHQAPMTVAQPLGWAYPYSCCAENDCRPLSRTEIKETPQGYIVLPSKDAEPIAYNDTKVKESKDGDYHWCVMEGPTYGKKNGTTRCLFVPPKGF
jgi:hypothetical protein